MNKRIIGNPVGVPNPKTNWNQTDENKSDVILNKPNIPTKTSELENDSNFVSDEGYVHTDNNFTDDYKEKLNSLGGETEDNSTIIVLDNNSPEVDKIYSKIITESIDFVLPTVTDGKFHQILILATIENTPAITYGTDYYFNGVVPTVDNGDCDIIFEFDGIKWTAGVISKGSEA